MKAQFWKTKKKGWWMKFENQKSENLSKVTLLHLRSVQSLEKLHLQREKILRPGLRILQVIWMLNEGWLRLKWIKTRLFLNFTNLRDKRFMRIFIKSNETKSKFRRLILKSWRNQSESLILSEQSNENEPYPHLSNDQLRDYQAHIRLTLTWRMFDKETLSANYLIEICEARKAMEENDLQQVEQIRIYTWLSK